MWQQLEYDFFRKWHSVQPNAPVVTNNFFCTTHPFPNFYKLKSSNFGFQSLLAWAVSFPSWNKASHGKKGLSTEAISSGWGWRAWEHCKTFLPRLLWTLAFYVNIRHFITLTQVTSSTRMKSSIPPGKTNFGPENQLVPSVGPAHPLISSQWGSAQL